LQSYNLEIVLTASAANRPKLKLIPRSTNAAPGAAASVPAPTAGRNTSIFGTGKPREAREDDIKAVVAGM